MDSGNNDRSAQKSTGNPMLEKELRDLRLQKRELKEKRKQLINERIEIIKSLQKEAENLQSNT